MKRTITLIFVATLLAALVPAGAGAAPGPQEEEGTIFAPAPGPNGETTAGCWTGWARRFYIFSNGAIKESPFGVMIEIDKATWNGKFKLEVLSGGTGMEDLDITFYSDPGEVDPADPAQQGGISETGAYLSRGSGGEKGTIAETTTLALVCLSTGSGYNAEFKYTGTPPKKKKKG